ncbi:MAG: DMT family transporter [Myxococcales bacterium]|nr:DMT family transporter [Polyangiaceae bacterium]MDW8250215.1 DMT family transporter [Myxococcales bacterium]
MTQIDPWPRGKAVLVVGAAALCFSTSGPLARVAAPAHPLLIAAGRTVLAALLLLLWSPRSTVRAVAALPHATLGKVLGVGLLLAAHFGFFLVGLSATSFAAAVTLVSLEPVAVVLVAWAAFSARPSWGEGLGVALATMGALVTATSGSSEHRLLGDLLVVIAVALYGLYVAAARGLAKALSPRPYAAAVYGAAGVSLGLVCGGLALGGHSFSVSNGSMAAILALAVIPTLGGHTLVQWSARHVPASLVALVSPGETVGSLLIGAVLLGQPPSAHEGAGAMLVLAGVVCTVAASSGQAPASAS